VRWVLIYCGKGCGALGVPAFPQQEGEPMKKKSNGRGMQGSRRQEILRIGAGLFREKGFDATTIRDITAAVGIGSGSTFCHFRSKRDILDEVARHGMDLVLAEAEAVVRRALAPAEQLRTLIQRHMTLLHDPSSRDFVVVLLFEQRALSAAAKAQLAASMARYEALWEDCLRRLNLSQKGRADVPVHRLLFGALNWTAHWLRPVADPSPQVLADEVAGLLLNGIPG